VRAPARAPGAVLAVGDAAFQQKCIGKMGDVANEGRTVLYVSHQIEEVIKFADDLVLMRQGKVVATGPVASLLTQTDLPLAHERDASALIEATVVSHDERYQLTRLKISGGCFSVSQRNINPGELVRLRVLARDVSLTLERQTGTSILNILEAKVIELMGEDGGHMTVRLEISGQSLLSRVTQKSADSLNLTPGKRVYAQVKSIALLN